MNGPASSWAARRHAQTGAAAVEFALALPILMLLMWGLLSFAALFYTQMAVSRAAHDGARAASLIPSLTELLTEAGKGDVKNAVIDSLAATPIAKMGHNASYDSRRGWLVNAVSEDIDVSSGVCDAGTCVVVRVEYPYGNGVRLLPTISLPGLGMLSFIPDTLVAQAVVVR